MGTVINIRKVCKKVKASPSLTQTIGGYCLPNKEPEIRVSLDIDIRWNSFYEMLLKALKIKISLTEISLKEKKLTPLVEEDWELAEVIVKVLSKFFYATKIIESQTQPLPTTRLYCIFTDLKNYLNDLYNDVNYIKFKDVFEKMIK